MPRIKILAGEHAKKIAAHLRSERLRHEVTIEDIAAHGRCTAAYLRQIELGHHDPTPRILKIYEQHLRLEEGYFLALIESSSLPGKEQYSALTSGIQIKTIDALPFTTLYNAISKSQERIQILDTWLGQDIVDLEDAFHEAFLRGVRIHIALINPRSHFARQRVKDLKTRESSTDHINGITIIKENLEMFMAWKRKWDQTSASASGRFEIKQYDCLPSVQLIIVDREAIVGLYFHHLSSRECPQLEVPLYDSNNKRTALGLNLEKEFEHIWKGSQEALPSTLSDG